MKLTKTFALAAIVAGSLFAGTALQAQDSTNTPPAGEKHGGPGMGRPDFAKELNLTDDQKPKFKEIMQASMEKRKALHDDTSLSADDRKAKGKAIMEDTTKQMKALLTDEQFPKWEKMMKNMRPHPPGGGAPPQQ